MEKEFLSLTEASKILGVSKNKMWKLVKEGTIKPYPDKLDKRKTLVKRSDIEKLQQPDK